MYVPTTHVEERIVRDTILEVRIPEHYAERETLDTLSELSNPFAYSRATVSSGKLTHTLGIKENAIVRERVQYIETTIRDTISYPVEVEVIREVEKPIRWWQKALMWVGVVSILSVGAYIAIKLYPK